jgi:hypothetical protein
MLRQFAFAAVLVAFFSLEVFAADPWIGQEVYCKNGAKAGVGSSQINIEVLPFPATVGKVKGDWLWLGRAWVRGPHFCPPYIRCGFSDRPLLHYCEIPAMSSIPASSLEFDLGGYRVC